MVNVINAQPWLVVVSWFVPLVTYVLNHYAPWASEAVKSFVLALAAAVTAGLYKAIDSGGFGWNQPTLKYVEVAVATALLAHHAFWKANGVSARLGGGTNA